MSYVSLGRFRLSNTGPGGQPCWTAPEGVTALVDLVPPAQDANPDVNYALMLSESPLDSEVCHHSFGIGNVTDLQIDGAGRDAWQSVTGFRPTAPTLAECLAEHLLTGSDPTGTDFSKPLTAGFNRGLEVHLGGLVWSHTLSGLSDELFIPVMRVEAESIAEVYRTLGETQYRLAMGALRKKYNTRPTKELIQFLYPSGRDDLPLMDELNPQTVKTETWPTTGAVTSGQDNTWTIVSGAPTVSPAGSIKPTSISAEDKCLLGYTFGGNDMAAQWTVGTGGVNGFLGTLIRSNATATNAYLLPYKRGNLGYAVFKLVSGTYTQLGANFSTSALNDVVYGSAIGSGLITKKNGSTIDSSTDTAVSSGTRVILYLYRDAASDQIMLQPLTFDDLVSGGSNRRRRVICGS